MKEPKNLINKIKVLLGVAVILEALKLDNGTVIEAENFEAGNEVFVITEANDEGEPQKVAMPEGEYMLEDGRSIKVDANGLIETIGEPEAEAQAEEEAEPEAEVEAEAETEAPSNPKKVVKQISEEVHFAKVKELEDTIAERDAKIVELSQEPEPEAEAEAEVVELEAQETEDVVHSPEAEVEKKVSMRKMSQKQSKIGKIYDGLFS